MNANENKPYKSHKALQPKVKGALSFRIADAHTSGERFVIERKISGNICWFTPQYTMKIDLCKRKAEGLWRECVQATIK